METNTCANCGNAPTCRCSRCKNISYCGKECQVKDWDTHKAHCNTPMIQLQKAIESVRANYIKHANDRITGNILIMASHNFAKYGPGTIVAEITETIEEFCVPGSFHFAHLSYQRESNDGQIQVLYKLANYQVMVPITPDPSINFSDLYKKHPEPEDGWSVIFNL